ncbi:MAG: chromosomal replication initiator protein DnaA [Bacteroidia bacterium]|nr:chromosomal replication initiator protein DnaA [Bacteroidia bacterium]
MKPDHNQIWSNCLEVIKDNINPQSFKTWFKPIKPLKLENNVLTIQVPSQFFYEWLEEHYVSLLRKTIKHFLGNEGRLEYSIIVENNLDDGKKYSINIPTASKEVNTKNPSVQMPLNISKSVPNPFVIPGIKKINIDSQLNPNYTFENFIEGDCNRLARAAGYAVATKPGQTAFNPLLVYGGVGLGKTHLAQAIGNEVKGQYPNKIVLYVSSEKFINQFIDAIKNNTVNDFISFYQLIDVLIVDDIQFFAGKEKTQDHFFHVFNHLHQSGKQIVLTSDCMPKDLKGMEERLLSRFKWGLSADLQIPDYQTRIAILKNKMYKDGIELPEDVIEYIAHNITTNVRELEGALISLLAQSSLNKREVDLELAKQMLKNFIKNVSREISIEAIQKLVCEHLNVEQELLKAKTRKREIVQARQISMYFAKELTKSSLKTIGLHFGGRDHSTVIHAVQTVNDLISIDKEFRRNIDDIKKKIDMSLA